jgi:hypothetical protein
MVAAGLARGRTGNGGEQHIDADVRNFRPELPKDLRSALSYLGRELLWLYWLAR